MRTATYGKRYTVKIKKKWQVEDTFKGDKKNLNHYLLAAERKVLTTLLPMVPLWLGTAHLTMMTLLWSFMIIGFGFLAVTNIQWLWGFSICIVLQHITDMLDGEVGRSRNTGLIKWGFYMDHFLDYIFLCSIVIGYSFLLPASYLFLTLICLAISGAFMVHVFLDFGITNDLKISFNRFGVSEVRWVLIGLNILLVIFGPKLLINIFPGFVVLSALGLVYVVAKSQKIYRDIDMERLKNMEKT